MNLKTVTLTVGALVGTCAWHGFAQEAEAETPAPEAQVAARTPSAAFRPLMRLTRAEGKVEVKLPKETGYSAAVEDKYYPCGTAFRVTEEDGAPCATIEFGEGSTLVVTNAAEFLTMEASAEKGQNRTIVPLSGKIGFALPLTLPTGRVTVKFPHFEAKDLAGESRFECVKCKDGDEVVVRVVTGIMAIDGAHYRIARMNPADQIRIRTSGDELFTSLRGESGDYAVTLDQGLKTYTDPISNESKTQAQKMDYMLTPQCAIKIFRKRSEVGGRMAVSVLTFNPAGEMRNHFTYAEGKSELNFGESIVNIKEISFKTDDGKKKNAEKAAEPAKEDEAAEAGNDGQTENN